VTTLEYHARNFALGSFDFLVQTEALAIKDNRPEFEGRANVYFIETGENERVFSPEEFENVEPSEIG
jgi:hypothetical protein